MAEKNFSPPTLTQRFRSTVQWSSVDFEREAWQVIEIFNAEFFSAGNPAIPEAAWARADPAAATSADARRRGDMHGFRAALREWLEKMRGWLREYQAANELESQTSKGATA